MASLGTRYTSGPSNVAMSSSERVTPPNIARGSRASWRHRYVHTNRIGKKGSRNHGCRTEGNQRYYRDQAVADDMLVDHAEFSDTLRSRRAHVILWEILEHGCARVAHQDRRLEQGQDRDGHDGL